MDNEMKQLMNLPIGSNLVCIGNPYKGTELNQVYTFLGYDESNVPKNDYNATMTWYTKKAIWTPEQYEDIRFKFMMVKLHGINGSVWLKDFNRYIFTD